MRDDLKATRALGDDTKPESYDGGIGYTILAWTTDGDNWKRDRFTDKFLAPDPDPAAWDHAHAWISAAVEVGDEVWLYYGGYKYGHKYYTDRSVGMAKIRRDRYVAREVGFEAGTLLTPPVLLRGRSMTVNAQVDGELQVRIVDASTGDTVPGFDSTDHPSIRGDGVALPVSWAQELSSLADQPVRIEFTWKRGSLFAFDLME